MENTKAKSHSLFFAIILGLNTVIGAGIFTMPIGLMKLAGPSGIISIALATIAVLFIGLSFGRIASQFENGGGYYDYANAWGGYSIGLLSAGLYAVGLLIASSLLVNYASSIIGVYMNSIPISYISYFIIIITIMATFFASSIGAIGQKVLLILTVFPLFIITYFALKTFSFNNFYPFGVYGFSGVIKGIPTAFFAFIGFETVISFSRILVNPIKNIPLAIIFTIILVGIIYMSFVGFIIGGFSSKLLFSKNVLSEVLLYSMPDYTWIVHFINISIIISILGTIYGIVWGLSELLITCTEKCSSKKYQLSEVLSLFLIGSSMFLVMKFFTNISSGFSCVALCVIATYTITIFYLILKPRNFIDKCIGGLGLISSVAIFFSAFLQLI